MLRFISFSLCIAVLLSTLTSAAQRKKDYLTEDELDLIREAQDIGPRIDAYLRLAKRRLIALGLTEKSQKDLEREKKEKEEYDNETKHAPKAIAKDLDILKPVTDFSYLQDFTNAELLRGFIEAIDESMTNIDDFYDRRADVRAPVEELEQFTRESIPLLEKYKPANATEKTALQDALAKAKESNSMAKEALKVVPKTEKKPPRR